ncbi:hypothetical protein TeGR_g7136, partial [Tetraparma gracilis]
VDVTEGKAKFGPLIDEALRERPSGVEFEFVRRVLVKKKKKEPVQTVEVYQSGQQCAERVKAYHNLLHYKFRVFNRILDRLTGQAGSIEKASARQVNGQGLMDFGKREPPQKTKWTKLKKDDKFIRREWKIYQERMSGAEFLLTVKGGTSSTKNLRTMLRQGNTRM